MLQFLKTWRKFLIPPALILACSVYWIANTREEKDRNILDRTVVTITAPIEVAVSWVIDGVKGVWYGYFYFVGLREANDALRAENERLRGEIAASWETALENERLRTMIAFHEDTPGTLVAASVIGSDAASFAKSMRINRGTSHGVMRNMAVVTPSGVVGRVIEASAFFSDVQLITDGRSAVPVRIQRTRAQGLMEGLSGGICHLKYVSRSEDVESGDVVITSGLGGIFPRGLVVGTVISVEKKEFGVLQEVRVAPAVDFRRLPEEVFVVTQIPESTPDEVPGPVAGGAAVPAPKSDSQVARPGPSGPEE